LPSRFKNAVAARLFVRAAVAVFAFALKSDDVFNSSSDTAGALADYNRAIELNPASAIGYFNRALVWRERGDLSLAKADYDRAVALDPRLADDEARERIRNRLMR
jgi:tetratricopeptide (TPR) repeat protein